MIRSDLEVSRSIRHRGRRHHRRGLFLHRPSPGLGSVLLRELEIVRSEAGARLVDFRGLLLVDTF